MVIIVLYQYIVAWGKMTLMYNGYNFLDIERREKMNIFLTHISYPRVSKNVSENFFACNFSYIP